MALRGRRIENFLELWWLVASRVVGIWVSSTSFLKSNISWPQQPPTKKGGKFQYDILWIWQINIFVELWCLVTSEDMEIWVSSTSFQKINIGWPQQPLTERVSDISKKMNFWGSIPQKGTGFDHLGARDDPNIRISNFFHEMRLLRSLRQLRLLRL